MCYVYTLNTDKMVKAYRYTSVFSVKCLKWKFLGGGGGGDKVLGNPGGEKVGDGGGFFPPSRVGSDTGWHYGLWQCHIFRNLWISKNTKIKTSPKLNIFYSNKKFINYTSSATLRQKMVL